MVGARANNGPLKLPDRDKGSSTRQLHEAFDHLSRTCPCTWQSRCQNGQYGTRNDAGANRMTAVSNINNHMKVQPLRFFVIAVQERDHSDEGKSTWS